MSEICLFLFGLFWRYNRKRSTDNNNHDLALTLLSLNGSNDILLLAETWLCHGFTSISHRCQSLMEVENQALTSFIGTVPSHWFRYVDDTWVKIQRKELEAFSNPSKQDRGLPPPPPFPPLPHRHTDTQRSGLPIWLWTHTGTQFGCNIGLKKYPQQPKGGRLNRIISKHHSKHVVIQIGPSQRPPESKTQQRRWEKQTQHHFYPLSGVSEKFYAMLQSVRRNAVMYIGETKYLLHKRLAQHRYAISLGLSNMPTPKRNRALL